jgi:hypothetical protein
MLALFEFGSLSFWVLVVLVIGLIGFYFWNKKRGGGG